MYFPYSSSWIDDWVGLAGEVSSGEPGLTSGCRSPCPSDTSNSCQDVKFARGCLNPPVLFGSIGEVFLGECPSSDSAVPERELTPCNHDFGPETIIYRVLQRMGGPCTLGEELCPNPCPRLFIPPGWRASWFCHAQLHQPKAGWRVRPRTGPGN